MRWLIPLFAAFVSACVAPDTPAACRLTHVADLPIQMVGNAPIVDVSINGHPAKLLLDTGAEAVTIREASFDRLGLARDYQSLVHVTGIGAQTSIWPSKPASLSLGSITLPPAVMLVSPIPVGAAFQGTFDGLLGSEVLSAYDLDVDMPARRLGLYERRLCPNGPPPFPDATNVVKAEGDRAYKLTVPVTLDGTPIQAGVDTGATRTLVDAQAAGLSDVDLSQDRALHMPGVDPVGMATRLHRFKQVQVGTETVANPLLAVGTFQPAGYRALLGSDYWRGRRVWISYGSRTVTIAPPQRQVP